MFSVAMLTGGQGRRFGGADKSQLVVGGRTIRARQITAARDAGADPFLVTAGPAQAVDAGVPVVVDRWPGSGALGALVTALEASPTGTVVVLAGDMPFVTGAFLAWLASRLGTHGAAVPHDVRGAHPLCAAYHRDSAAPLRRAFEAGVRKVQEAVAALDARRLDPEDYAAFDPQGRLLLNINRPDDYHAALDTDP